MKGLLLVGGYGTRLRPLTYTGNKHLLPIANKPMLLYGLEHLRSAGIRDIGVVLGPVHEGIRHLLGDGSDVGVKVTYINQMEPKGLAHAVMVAQEFLAEDAFIMYLGDNLLKTGVGRFKEVFETDKADCVIGITPVKNPSAFGVVEVKNGRIVGLEEKPKKPKTNLALIGVYVFNQTIFEAVEQLKPSWRGELEITDAIRILVQQKRRVKAERVEGWWKDTGKPEDLLEANQLVLADLKTNIRGTVSSNTHCTGPVDVGNGTRTIGRVSIKGPVIIGADCRIGPDVHIGPYASIGNNCVLKNVELENSIVMKGCRIESCKRIVDSLIGNSSVITNSGTGIPQGYRLIVGENSFAQL